ncbi:unnamed protein product [Closterium sp. NIES-53]
MAGNTSAGAGESSAQDRSGNQDSGVSAPRGARTNQGSLINESLELNQYHHVMHLLPEVDCGPKAWTVLKELHAPISVVATLMLERKLSTLRLSEGELVQPVLDKMRDLYAKLATAGITYLEQTKCLKMLSLLPESWLQFTSRLSLPQNQSLWTLERVQTKTLEEDFRRRQLRGGDDGSSGYGTQGSRRGPGCGFGGAGRGAKKEDDSNDQQGGTGWGRGAKSGRGGKSGAGGKMKGSCWYCEKEGHPWFLCYKKPDGWTPQNRNLDGSARRNQKNGANMVADSSDNNLKSNGTELHPLDYWVLDTGASWTMTPRKGLHDDVRTAPINEVCSASGHALKVAGAGQAAFKGADGKPVVLHDVLLVPDLEASLISLRKLAKARVSTSTDGARTYKGQLGDRVLWDLHESKDMYKSMWQLPALAWHDGGQAGEGSASQRECNAVGGVGVKVVTGKSKKPLELVQMDFVGPLPVQGHKGERYFLTIVEDWSRLMWAYPLKHKDHAASTIKEDWLPFVEKQAECVVKRIRTDRGGEFLGAEMTAWLKKQSIQRDLTTACTPQSNGVSERANRIILETARTLHIESGVGNSMWPHAVRHATVARNRMLTNVGNESWVPLERWLGRKPLVDMLRVFGCMAVAHVPKKYRSKLGASAIWCVHLGLAAESKGWLLWEPSKGVLFDSRDVNFVEGMMYGAWKKQPENKVSQQMEQITMQPDLTLSLWEEGEEAAAEGGDREKVQEASGSTIGAAGLEGADVAEQQLGNEEYEPAYCFLAPAPEEPASIEEALAGPDREKWLVSRDAEYQSLLENGTWDVVVLPKGKKAVQCKWVLRIKTNDKGQVTIYKSRLVTKGFKQKEKQDFNEIFAPTAKPPTLHFLLADADVSGKFIIQMDISMALLDLCILEEDVYMTQPPGYEDGTGRVCKLKKSIYGLKQAPRCWYQKLAAVLEEMGFRTSSCDESHFLKGEGEKMALFLVYVDDILLFSSSMKEIQKMQQQLMKSFKCKTLGEVKYYLGMHVERDLDHKRLKLHQEKFIMELGEKYGIENERKVATPLPAEFKLVKAAEDEGVEVKEQQQFQSLVGSFLYTAVKQKRVDVLKEKGGRLGEGKLFLTCFTDATWASKKDDSLSVGRYICAVGGGPVGWRSKKQTETAFSSVESEYMAMFHGVKEVIWLGRLLEEIGQEQQVATPLFCDSKAALGLL